MTQSHLIQNKSNVTKNSFTLKFVNNAVDSQKNDIEYNTFDKNNFDKVNSYVLKSRIDSVISSTRNSTLQIIDNDKGFNQSNYLDYEKLLVTEEFSAITTPSNKELSNIIKGIQSEILRQNQYHVFQWKNGDVEEIHHDNNKLDSKIDGRSRGELEIMKKEIENSILNFENKVKKLAYVLIFLSAILSLPNFIGLPALVGVIGSLILLLYVNIRRWERNFIE